MENQKIKKSNIYTINIIINKALITNSLGGKHYIREVVNITLLAIKKYFGVFMTNDLPRRTNIARLFILVYVVVVYQCSISNVMYTEDIEALFVVVHAVFDVRNTPATSWNLPNYYLNLAWIGRFTHIMAFTI